MCLVLRQYSEDFKVDGLFFHTMHFFILDLVQESFLTGLQLPLRGKNLEWRSQRFNGMENSFREYEGI